MLRGVSVRKGESHEVPRWSANDPGTVGLGHARVHAGQDCLAVKLIQHDYLNDPWNMMVACTLLNRTRCTTAKPILKELVERWPTAKAVASLDEGSDEYREFVKLITPLGFYNRRASTLTRMAQDAASGRVVGTWHGIGQYAYDSWMIFVVGQVVDAEDKELRAYLEFIRDCGEAPPSYYDNGVWYHPAPLKIMRLKG